jgi:hypothetical protein
MYFFYREEKTSGDDSGRRGLEERVEDSFNLTKREKRSRIQMEAEEDGENDNNSDISGNQTVVLKNGSEREPSAKRLKVKVRITTFFKITVSIS